MTGGKIDGNPSSVSSVTATAGGGTHALECKVPGRGFLGDHLAVLDLDGTLSAEISWDRISTWRECLDEHRRLYQRLRAGSISSTEASRLLVDLWNRPGQLSRADLLSFFESLPVRDEASAMVHRLKSMGLQVAIISGSMDIYVSSVAKRLGVEAWYANSTLTFSDSGQLNGLQYDLDQSRVKLTQLRAHLLSTGISRARVVAVGDSENDIDIFRYTGRGILLRDHEPSAQLVGSVRRVTDSLQDVPALIESLFVGSR